MQRQPILTDRDLSLFELKTRFVRNYLTFAGKNSKDFLLYISGPGVYDSPFPGGRCGADKRPRKERGHHP